MLVWYTQWMFNLLLFLFLIWIIYFLLLLFNLWFLSSGMRFSFIPLVLFTLCFSLCRRLFIFHLHYSWIAVLSNSFHFWHSSYGMGSNGLTATRYHYILHYCDTNRSEIFVFIVNFSRPLSEFQPLTSAVIQALQTIIKKKFSRVKLDMGWLTSVSLLESAVKNIFPINYLYNMFRFLFEEEYQTFMIKHLYPFWEVFHPWNGKE